MAQMTKSIATLGELMMRLKPPGKQRLRQAHELGICFGGSEANVATSLAQWGHSVRFITGLPESDLGSRAISELNYHGVDTRFILRNARRLGLYFLEEGADLRSGCVIYDRKDTAFSSLKPQDVDWDNALSDVDWFHISGITPAINAQTLLLAEHSIAEARQRNIHISLDLNFRERLWAYGVRPADILPNLVEQCDTLSAGRGDCINCLEIDGDGENGSNEWAESLACKLQKRFSNLTHIALTIRASSSADCHNWRAYIQNPSDQVHSRSFQLSNIVDRVGSGDAFCAGIIHSIGTKKSLDDVVNFGAMAAVLKHSIIGDFNHVSVGEIEDLMRSQSNGRLRR